MYKVKQKNFRKLYKFNNFRYNLALNNNMRVFKNHRTTIHLYTVNSTNLKQFPLKVLKIIKTKYNQVSRIAS